MKTILSSLVVAGVSLLGACGVTPESPTPENASTQIQAVTGSCSQFCESNGYSRSTGACSERTCDAQGGDWLSAGFGFGCVSSGGSCCCL